MPAARANSDARPVPSDSGATPPGGNQSGPPRTAGSAAAPARSPAPTRRAPRARAKPGRPAMPRSTAERVPSASDNTTAKLNAIATSSIVTGSVSAICRFIAQPGDERLAEVAVQHELPQPARRIAPAPADRDRSHARTARSARPSRRNRAPCAPGGPGMARVSTNRTRLTSSSDSSENPARRRNSPAIYVGTTSRTLISQSPWLTLKFFTLSRQTLADVEETEPDIAAAPRPRSSSARQ